jgi:hypothetical protein
MVNRRHARLVSQGAPGMARPGTPSRRTTEMGQSRRRSFSQELIYQSRDASRPSSHFRTSLFR